VDDFINLQFQYKAQVRITVNLIQALREIEDMSRIDPDHAEDLDELVGKINSVAQAALKQN